MAIEAVDGNNAAQSSVISQYPSIDVGLLYNGRYASCELLDTEMRLRRLPVGSQIYVFICQLLLVGIGCWGRDKTCRFHPDLPIAM